MNIEGCVILIKLIQEHLCIVLVRCQDLEL